MPTSTGCRLRSLVCCNLNMNELALYTHVHAPVHTHTRKSEHTTSARTDASM